MGVKTVEVGGLSFSIESPKFQSALSRHDINGDTRLNEEDAMWSGDFPDGHSETELTQWVHQKLRQTSVQSDDKPSLDMMLDAVSAYQTVKPVSDMVDVLRKLPHEKGFWSGVEYRYDGQTWVRDVLPFIGGTTAVYKDLVLNASSAYKTFGDKYGLLDDVGTCGVHSASACGQTHSLAYLYKIPASLRPAIVTLTEAMSNIVNWQRGDVDGRHSQIECKGEGCPDDDEADAFSTDFVSELCYLTEEMGDATCYDYTANPHIAVVCYAIYCWVHDERTGNIAGGWGWSDSLTEAMGYKPR